MSDEEYKAIKILNDLLLERNKDKIEITTYDLFGNIEIVLDLVRKQKTQIGFLRELLYMIRQETRYNTISFENNYYRPIKNVTKQQIYESYNIIRTLVKGNYVLMDNKEAIDSIVGKE